MKVKIFSGKSKKTLLIVLVGILLAGAAFFLFKKPAGEVNTKKLTASNSAQVQKKEPVLPKLSLESIFASKSASLAELDQNKIVKLVATGDVITARGANWPAVKSGNYHINWEKTADFLRTGDITLINLETPLFKDCALQSTGTTFCGKDRHVEGIAWAGVDVASLANNHIDDYGPAGIEATQKLLSGKGILWSGFGHLATKEVKGMKFGFLSYNALVPAFPRTAVAAEIAKFKPSVDILVVSIHWGNEYVAYPEKAPGVAPDNPRELAHLIIDAGADLIIGNHPHWVQGVEFYKEGFVTYAHGNFIFDQTWSEETKEGVVGEYTFYDRRLIAVRFLPTKFEVGTTLSTSYQPSFVTGKTADKILKRMYDSSLKLNK